MFTNTQSYTAGYQWTKALFLEAIRHHYRSKVRPSLVMAVSVTAVLFSALSLLILSTARLRFPRDGWVFVFPGFTLFWFFLRRRASDWWFGRGFDKRPDAGLSVEWEFSQQGVKFRCGDLASSTLDWKLFNKLVETNEGYLLYIYPGRLFHWLPFSAFGSPEGIDKLRQFVKDHEIPAEKAGW